MQVEVSFLLACNFWDAAAGCTGLITSLITIPPDEGIRIYIYCILYKYTEDLTYTHSYIAITKTILNQARHSSIPCTRLLDIHIAMYPNRH